MSGVFGLIVSGRQVRLAMRDHLQIWLPTYLAEVARNEDREPADLPAIRSWVSALDMPDGRYEEHQLPSCVIAAPGLLTEPERSGGFYRAVWGVSVGCVVSGQDRENTFELCEIYTAAVRAAVMHNASLGGFATATDWLGERYDDIPNDMLRTLAAGSVQFAVDVKAALSVNAGPDKPLSDTTIDPAEAATFIKVDADVKEYSEV